MQVLELTDLAYMATVSRTAAVRLGWIVNLVSAAKQGCSGEAIRPWRFIVGLDRSAEQGQ